MTLKYYHVDAFTTEVFRGNPAGVCPLDEWLPGEVMQSIAAENKHSETAFFVKEADGYRIRWFTPRVEVDLCGHATLASGYVLMRAMKTVSGRVVFNSRSGRLEVRDEGDRLTLDFPSDEIKPAETGHNWKSLFGCAPEEVYRGRNDYLLVFGNESQIRDMKPDFRSLAKIETRGFIVTAPGNKRGFANCDFVSRFFAPGAGIDEDPVTGSAHTTLTPYWSRRLGKNALDTLQVSERGGVLHCELKGGRVDISGNAVLYLEGSINI